MAASPAPDRAAERMDDTELQGIVSRLIADAVGYTDGELSEQRARATDYYLGKPLGNEEEGRSQVVLTEVRDVVRSMLPSMVRVFFGADRTVEFVPRTAATVDAAEQASEACQYVFAEDNGGAMLTLSVVTDALVRKLGVFKAAWDDTGARKPFKLDGVSQTQLEQLAADEGVELQRIEQTRAGAPVAEGQPPVEATFTVEGTRAADAGRVKLWALPPEEFLFSSEARDLETAAFIGHRTDKTRGELIAMGISAEDIDAHGGMDLSLRDSVENLARRGVAGAGGTGTTVDAGEANEKILYVEGYPLVDFDGDGVAELRRVCTIGPSHFVVVNEPAEERPFALFTPVPEPHSLIGQSFADLTMDLQRWKSSLVRAINDSAAASIFPRIGYVEGQVNPADILNTALGAPIRMRAPGMVQPIVTPFLGQEMMGLVAYVDDVVERRTGQNKGAAGLDANALQSSTQAAVGAAVSASQESKELLCRIFAEQTLKPLFRLIYKLLVRHQDRPRMMRLRGRYVEVDPRAWDADLDVSVQVAVGTASTEQKLAVLAQVAQKQEQILQMLGPSNPLCSLAQYGQTLVRGLELSGFKDAAKYFNAVDPNWQPPQQAPQPSPEQVLAQAQMAIEQQKTQKDLQIKQAELELKQQTSRAEFDFKAACAAQDFELRRYEIDLKYHADITQQQMAQDTQQDQQLLQGQMEIHQQAHDQALAEQQQQHEQALAAQDQQHQQQLAAQQQAADQQQQSPASPE